MKFCTICRQMLSYRALGDVCPGCRRARTRGIALGFVWGFGLGFFVMLFGGW